MRRIKNLARAASAALLLFAAGAVSASAQTTTCGMTTWDLTAGQTIKVGTVTVCNDATNLYVTYTLTAPGWTFGNLHMWAGSDLANLPKVQNGPNAGTPIPGQFCSALGGACYDATGLGLTTYTFTISLAKLNIPDINLACGAQKQLNVVTHAEVSLAGATGHETAFGGDQTGSGPRWWFFGKYSICCDFGQPPPSSQKTAFAKGGWVWVTDKKSNPENLPSLKMTQNRWGWAINLAATGTTTYDVWAGAGLNRTSSGTKVGTATVNWNGTEAVVTYNLFTGFTLEEVHVYAGDPPPPSLAPGQFGYINDPGTSTHSVTLPLADTNGTGGVWLILHAVVSGPF